MQIPFNEIYFNNDVSFAAVYKKINELVKGDKFMAEIVDIKAETVTLKLNDNSTLEAKSLVLPDARIGERVVFAVKDNSDSVIQIEFVKNADADISDNFANGILSRFEIPVNSENRRVIKLLAENNVELNQENVNKAMFYKYSDSSDNLSAEKLLFLLEENIPAQKNTVSVLNDIMDKNISMKSNILSLCEELVSVKDTPLGEKIFRLLDIDKDFFENSFKNSLSFDFKAPLKNSDLKTLKKEEAVLKNLFNAVADKFFLKLKDKTDLRQTPDRLQKIYETAVKGREICENTGETLAKTFDNIKKNLEFTSHINEFKQYIQIPFSFGDNRKNQCELYVFKNPKGSAINSERASVLLGLDTAFLGRVEIYINKSLKSLNLQIKSDKSESLSLFKKGFSRLEALLKNSGYSISGVSFKNIEEPFDVTKKLEPENAADNNGNIKKKRFSFDMRI